MQEVLPPLSPYALALASLPVGVETIPIVDREQWLKLRERDVTASVIAALLGIHPHENQTPFGLWALKSGRVQPAPVPSEPEISSDGNEVTLPPAARGHRREAEAVSMLSDLRPNWSISYPLASYWRIPAEQIGATPDVLAVDPKRPGYGNIQIKSVSPESYTDKWLDPDTREPAPPLWVAVQAITEAKLVGASWCAIGVHRENYGSRPTLRIIDVPIHEAVWLRILTQTRTFWGQVKAGTSPDPDFMRDGDLIARLYAESDEDASVDLTADSRAAELAAKRQELKEIEAAGSVAEKDRKAVDAELIFKLGNAETGILPGGGRITAKTVRRGGYEVKPTSYRTVKIKGGLSVSLAPAARKATAALSTAIPERF